MPAIQITSSSFNALEHEGLQALAASGWDIRLNPHKRKLSETEATELLAAPDVVGAIAGVEPLTSAVLAAAKALKVISRLGSGLDSVDLDAASALNILVYNTPAAPVPSVAELAIALMLNCLRAIPSLHLAVRDGKWPRGEGRLLATQRVGVVGFGRIGQRVAELAAAFGATVQAFDPLLPPGTQNGIALVPLETLLATSTIITLHCPLTAETQGLISTAALGRMQDGTILINTARGALVDESALLAALTSGRIAAAGLDVYNEEPYTGPLAQHPNTVLTPHIASSARETRARMEAESVDNLIAGLKKAGAW